MNEFGNPPKAESPEIKNFHFSAIAETTDDAIIGKDLNGNVTAWNPGAQRMFGYSAEEMMGQSITRIIPEQRLGEEAEILNRVHDGGTISHFMTERRRKDGVIIEVMLTISPIRDDRSNIIGVSKIARDVTAMQIAQRELVRREALLCAILDVAPDALIVIDESGIIQSFSSAATRLFGFEAAEAEGCNVSILMPEPHRGAHDSYLNAYLTSGQAKIIGVGRIITGQRKDGSVFPMELQVGEVKLGTQRLFAGFVRDLTERQERERRIKDLQAEVIHMSRVNDLGQMVSALAHEVNQPLTAISNYLAGVRRLLAKGSLEGLGTVLDRLDEQGDRARQIIQRIRDQVAKREMEVTPVSAAELIGEAVGLSAVRMDRSLNLSILVDPRVGHVLVDKVQIQQVLLNLIRNALEAMSDTAERTLAVTAAPGGSMVEIRVVDNGPGLPEMVRQKLFQPFITTKASGMGVGLSLCHAIVDAHGGRLSAADRDGGGTVFSFTVPIFLLHQTSWNHSSLSEIKAHNE